MLISDVYRQGNAELHENMAAWGLIKDADINLVRQLIVQYQPRSILDYGCGKGRLGKVLRFVQSYDPGVPEFAGEPHPHDLVVCTAVLEHVEPEMLDAVLDELKSLALKAIMLTVDCLPSALTLSDGRNAHLIQEPLEWWLPKLMERWNIKTVATGSRSFTFVGTSI